MGQGIGVETLVLLIGCYVILSFAAYRLLGR